jgi:hypothetical protein
VGRHSEERYEVTSPHSPPHVLRKPVLNRTDYSREMRRVEWVSMPVYGNDDPICRQRLSHRPPIASCNDIQRGDVILFVCGRGAFWLVNRPCRR